MLVKDFLIFVMYYVILKAILLFMNIEFRRNHVKIPAAVAGLFA